jgi:Spy/CpxP family protein refolding chaperone
MANLRFYKILLVILLILNITTVSYIWINKSGMNEHGGPHRPDVFSFLCKELQLTEQQQRQYEDLRNEHHQSIERIQEKARQFREHFFDLIHTSPTDSVQVKQLADSIASTQQKIELATFYHFQKVRAICTPEQQKRFDEVIQDALKMMAPTPPPQH